MTAMCTICSNAAARALVDGALIAGERPSQIFKEYGESTGLFSRSACYRHARAHRPVSNLLPVMLGDVMSGEVVADAAALFRSNYESHVDAKAAGKDAIAQRYASEARQGAADLMKIANAQTEAEALALLTADQMRNVLSRLLYVRQDLIDDAETVAAGFGFTDLADDIATLPGIFAAHDVAKTSN
jgi:hypothetical protein